MKELRQFERFVLDAPARLYLDHHRSEASPMIRTVAHDISSGGAFIKMPHKDFSQNSDLIIEVILTIDALQKLYGYSNEVKLTSKANIIRTSSDGIAVCFTGKPVMISNTQF